MKTICFSALSQATLA